MAVQITCPHCGGTLRSQKPISAGAKISCPKCHSAFQVPGQERVSNRIAPQQPPRQQNGVNPAVASAPRRNRPTSEGEDLEDQEPRKTPQGKRPGGKKKSKGKSNALLFGILGGVGAVVIVAGVIAFIVVSNSGNKGGDNNSPFGLGNENAGLGNDPKKKLQESACVYDDGLTKYLPENTDEIRVLDFLEARKHNLLGPMAEVIQRSIEFGSWEAKYNEGISILKKAGIAKESLKSITQITMGPSPERPVFMHFTEPPDQKKLIEALFYEPVQLEGKTIYKANPLKDGGKRNLAFAYFLKPEVIIFGPSEKTVLSVTQAKDPPVVSADLIQAIKMTRGPLPHAATHSLGNGNFHFFQREVNYADWLGKPKAYATWYLPGQGEVHTYYGYLYPDEKQATEAEEKSKKVFANMLTAFEANKAKVVQELVPAAREMYNKLTIIREGANVTAYWPLKPILIERFFGFKGHGLSIN